MEDKNQYPLNGNWGHLPHHTRPFFCVPQPTQPYFTTYPWNINPYSQYGFPWPAISYGRYMAPVQYMQQPYIVPQAPLYPADYRRIFSQHYSFPPAQEVNFLQHVERLPLQRETACSEAQTEPYDSVNKTSVGLAAEDMGSNCAVTSSTPAPGKERIPSCSEKPGVGAPLPHRVCINSQKPGDPAIQQSSLNKSGPVLYDAESSQGCLEECVLSNVMPLDGSSVNDVCLNEKGTESEQQQVYQHPEEPDGRQMEDAGSTYPDSGVQECGPMTQSLESKEMHSPTPNLPHKQDSNLVSGSNSTSEADTLVIPETGDVEDLPFRILRLPCTQMTTTCLLEKPDSLWCAEKMSSILLPESSLLRADGYSFYPHKEQERQSVLSPSLDELSSRDELFSTDVEDVDLVTEPGCVEGGRLTDGSNSHSTPLKGEENSGSEEGCTACQETCSTCGLRVMAKSSDFALSEYADSVEYCGDGMLDEADSDCTNLEECEDEWYSYEAHEVPVKNLQCLSRHSASQCYRSPKSKPKKEYYGERATMVQEERNRGYLRELESCERKTLAKMDKDAGRPLYSAPPRTYSGLGEDTLASEKVGWGNCGKPKTRPWKPGNRNREMAASRGASCKKLVPPRPRRNEFDEDNEAEFSQYKKGRGSAKKKSSRY